MNKKQTLIVTGSSSGIGKAISLLLLKNGFHVIGISRHAEKIVDPNYQAINLDLSDTESLPDHLEQLAREHIYINGIIFCAGYGRFGSLEEFSYQQIIELLEVNLLSQIYLTRAFLPALKKQGSGDLIYIGSESALSGGKRGAVYSASKFGLRGFAQSLRKECSSKNIKVTLINPGMARTDFFTELDFEPGDHQHNAIEVKDIADAVLLTLNMSAGTVIDELNLSPQKKVIQPKNK